MQLSPHQKPWLTDALEKPLSICCWLAVQANWAMGGAHLVSHPAVHWPSLFYIRAQLDLLSLTSGVDFCRDSGDPEHKKGRQLHLGSFPAAIPAAM